MSPSRSGWAGALYALRAIAVHGIPLVVAIGAALAMLLWIMGASSSLAQGIPNAYEIGLAALFLYPACYQVLIIVYVVSRWRRWSVARLFLQLIWASLVVFAAAMLYALARLRENLPA